MDVFYNEKTKKFYVKSVSFNKTCILCDLNCSYSQSVLIDVLSKQPNYHILFRDDLINYDTIKDLIQFSDFENINWEPVMKGNQRASSYLIRKGLSRKAQLSLQIKKYFSKNSLQKDKYNACFPFTIIIQTWNAFEDIKIDFSPGVSASFDTSSHFSNVTFRQRLE